jgi:hypothetical protein
MIAVAVVLFAVAGYLAYRFSRQDKQAAAPTGGDAPAGAAATPAATDSGSAPVDASSADSLLGGTEPAPGATTES